MKRFVVFSFFLLRAPKKMNKMLRFGTRAAG
jgi:hypothetical protein